MKNANPTMKSAAWLATLLISALLALPAFADDPAKEISSKLQTAKSRMMGMQIDQAVALFKEATTLFERLKSEDPNHKDLASLQSKYDKLAKDLSKKVTQRAERAINPMRSQLEKELGGSDKDKIKQARDKLAEAIAEQKENLEAAGGKSGAALLASAQELLTKADTTLGAAPAEKPAQPQAAPAKPTPATPVSGGGDPKQINSEIQRKFRGMRDMSTPEMVKAAEEVRQLIAQLRAADPNHNKLAEYEDRVNKMVADAYAADVGAARNEIQRRIDRIEMYLERNLENERPQLKEQRELLGKALETHRAALQAAGPEGQKLIAETEAAIKKADQSIGTALAGDALANEWIGRLDPYRRNGAKDVTGGINGSAMYAEIKRLRAEAETVWNEYQQVQFPQGKTKDLEETESYFRQSIEEADRNLEYAVSSRLEKTQGLVKRIADFFGADQAWKTDKTKKPKPFSDELLDEAGKAIEDLAGYVPEHAEVAKLRQQFEALQKEAAERRDANKALTLLRADKYKGADADELKAFAKKLVPKTHEGAEVLRLTLYKPDWKEETVTEWTDTTHSALRTRTTRTLMFCVAFKDKDGVYRDFGYLNQDRLSSGGWGPTYGHLAKYRAPMLEENVKKDAPEEE